MVQIMVQIIIIEIVKVKVVVVGDVIDVVDVLGLKFSKGSFPYEGRCLTLLDLGRRIDENRWKMLLLGSVERLMKVMCVGGYV